MTKKNKKKSLILVVDDNPTNIDILIDVLTNNNYNTVIAKNGKNAINKALEVKPDLILLDVMMPGIDGFETCKKLKANKETKEIPIIFITVLTETKNIIKGLKVGAIDYIIKPIKAEEVLARIKNHLSTQFLKKELKEKNDELKSINMNLEDLVKAKTKHIIEQEKSAVIGRMIQGVVHNFKNPLSVIYLNNQIIENCISKNSIDDINSSVKNIFFAVEQMNSMVDNLMIKTRMDQQKEYKKININELLKRELNIFNADLKFNEIEKEFNYDDTIKELNLIYSNISQVIQNIIKNAIDSMWQTNQKKLTINTYQDKMNIKIEIKDSGCGIPKNKLLNIFDVFYTTKPPKGEEKKDQPTGTGIGLHVCKELLKPFKGKIEVDSKLKKGTVFTIILPKKKINSKKKK